MKTLLGAALLAAVCATPALAQDNPAFTGIRAEGLIGYDRPALPVVSDPDGLLYGVGVGYDFATSGFLLGVEAEAADSTAKKDVLGIDVKTGRDLYVGGRIGTVLGGANLLYLKAGYTNARFTADGFGGENLDGVRVGVGVERAVSTNTFVKAEYRYSNYESDTERHQAVVGFGFRF